MNNIISCCGVVCSDCDNYPKDCKGCPDIKGNVFWLQYAGAEICPIYDCCINEKHLSHCGLCKKLPCKKFKLGDPTKTKEENAEILKKQLAQLKIM